MSSLKELRFSLIIGVLLLVGLISLFFTLQKNIEYKSFKDESTSKFESLKAGGSTSRTIRDVFTLDGKGLQNLKSNQLFGYSLSGNVDDIKVMDSYDGTNLNWIDSGATSSQGTVKITLLLGENSDYILDSDIPGKTSTLGKINRLQDFEKSNPSTFRGRTLNNGAIIYTLPTKGEAESIISSYLSEGTLIGSSSIVVPFGKQVTLQNKQYTPDSCFTVVAGKITAYLATCEKTVKIPPVIGGVTIVGIGPNAFQTLNITEVVFPETITSIGSYSFKNNDLKQIVIPDSVTIIDTQAFSSNVNLYSVHLGKNLVTLGNNSFAFCGLFEVYIPASVTNILQMAFAYNRIANITDIHFGCSGSSLPSHGFSIFLAQTAKDGILPWGTVPNGYWPTTCTP